MTDNTLTVTRQSISLITDADSDAARKIKMLLPYGNKLTDDNALALAAYSRLHGLDPFNGECYFLVRDKKDQQGNVIGREELGVYPGIRGKRKLAKLQLQSIDPEGSYRIDYLIVGPDAVGLKPQPGEISVVVQAELRDSQSTARYIADTIQLSKAGIDTDTIKAIMGKPPVWTGYGVVKQSEVRYIKQTPIVLAKKRAESDATNQRFDLPFSDDALADDIAPDIVNEQDAGIVTVTPTELTGKTTNQLIAELGFDVPDEEIDAVSANVETPVKTETVIVDKPHDKLRDKIYAPDTVITDTDGTMKVVIPANLLSTDDVDTATNSKGELLIDLQTDKLSYMANALMATIKKNGLTPMELAAKQAELKAITTIIAYRNKATE